MVAVATPNRLLHVAEAMRLGMSDEDIYDASKIHFIEQATHQHRAGGAHRMAERD